MTVGICSGLLYCFTFFLSQQPLVQLLVFEEQFSASGGPVLLKCYYNNHLPLHCPHLSLLYLSLNSFVWLAISLAAIMQNSCSSILETRLETEESFERFALISVLGLYFRL